MKFVTSLAAALIFVFGIQNPTARGASEILPKAIATSAAALPSLSSLERDVWNALPEQLLQLEVEVTTLLQNEPKSPLGHFLMALLLVRRFEESRTQVRYLNQTTDLVEQAAELAPTLDFGYVAMAEILDIMGQTEKARNLLRQARAAGIPNSWRLQLTEARLAIESTEPELVLASLDKAYTSVGALHDVITPYAVAVIQSGWQGKARLSRLIQWNARHNHAITKQAIAVSLSETGDYTRAHLLYTTIARENPEIAEAAINAAILSYRHLGKPKEAQNAFAKIMQSKPTGLSDTQLATVYAHWAASLLATKDYRPAEEIFLRAYGASSNSLAVVDFATKEYREGKRSKELTELLSRIVREHEGKGIVYAILGETLSEDLADHRQAVRAYRNAIVLEPDRSEYFNGLGLAHYRSNEVEIALAKFRLATRLNPTDASARYNEACMLAVLDRRDEALISLEEAINLDARLIEHARSDADLRNLHNERRFAEILKSNATDSQNVASDKTQQSDMDAH